MSLGLATQSRKRQYSILRLILKLRRLICYQQEKTMATEVGENKLGGRNELMAELDKLGIKSTTVEHPEVFTVEAMMPYIKHLEGAVSKNLFLKDKKKKFWLLSALHNREINLNALAKKVSAPGGLRFADESIMLQKLGVGNGCVTALSLFNDSAGDVRFILDSAFLEVGHPSVFFHPMVNTATTGLSPEDFKKFLTATGHEPILVNFDEI